MACEKYLRELILVGIYMLGILGIVASGGGGGSGDEDDDEIVIQALYNFRIGGPLIDDPSNSTIGIEKGAPAAFTLMTEPNVVGTVICDQVTEICELQTVDNPSSILINDPTDTLFTGDINLIVDNFWVYPSGAERPSTGSLLIDRAVSDITVAVTNCPGGDVEVTIGMTSTCYTWDAFEDLMDDRPITDAAIASLAWELVAFTAAQGLNVLEVFPLIVDDLFAAGNPITESCETWLGGWPVNPPALNPGFFTFGWLDDSGNGRVGPGDSFSQTFNDCWFGGSVDGTLLQGVIDYVGYTEVVDQNGLLTRIGFETATQGSGKIGGVALGDGVNPLVITETTENSGIITPEPPISLTGRYFIVFE